MLSINIPLTVVVAWVVVCVVVCGATVVVGRGVAAVVDPPEVDLDTDVEVAGFVVVGTASVV